jgi:histidinol-phosphate phosphatase family protein
MTEPRTSPLRPALFLDRDGTINREVRYVTRPEQLELLSGAARAIRRLNQAGVLAVVVTNQSAVARGLCTLAELARVHERLRKLLAAEGASLDGLYFCPHHPDAGEEGSPFRVACRCRKPGPGLIEAAVRELPIDLTRSAIVGDAERDMGLAANAGVPGYLLGAGKVETTGMVTVVAHLEEAVELWLRSINPS